MNSFNNRLQIASATRKNNISILPPKLKHVILTIKLPKLSQTKRSLPWPAAIQRTNFSYEKVHRISSAAKTTSRVATWKTIFSKFLSSWTTSAKGYKFHQQERRQFKSNNWWNHRISGQFLSSIKFIDFKNIDTISYKNLSSITFNDHQSWS